MERIVYEGDLIIDDSNMTITLSNIHKRSHDTDIEISSLKYKVLKFENNDSLKLDFTLVKIK